MSTKTEKPLSLAGPLQLKQHVVTRTIGDPSTMLAFRRGVVEDLIARRGNPMVVQVIFREACEGKILQVKHEDASTESHCFDLARVVYDGESLTDSLENASLDHAPYYLVDEVKLRVDCVFMCDEILSALRGRMRTFKNVHETVVHEVLGSAELEEDLIFTNVETALKVLGDFVCNWLEDCTS